MNKNIFTIISLILILTLLTGISSAASVEPVKLPAQLREGDPISFNINIKTGDGEKTLTIETSLVPINNKPLYDFGELNQYITENRYNQKITLKLTGISSTIPVNISGRVPDGETQIKARNDDDIILTKFIDTELKFYEVHADQTLSGIETFQVIINKKEKFDNTLKSIRRPEFDGLKSSINRLFEMGLVTEAQDLADKLSNVKFPNNLLLLQVLPVDNDLALDAIYIISIIAFFLIGYKIGSRRDENEYDI